MFDSYSASSKNLKKLTCPYQWINLNGFALSRYDRDTANEDGDPCKHWVYESGSRLTEVNRYVVFAWFCQTFLVVFSIPRPCPRRGALGGSSLVQSINRINTAFINTCNLNQTDHQTT